VINPGPTFPSSPFRAFMSLKALFPWYSRIGGDADSGDLVMLPYEDENRS